VWGGGGGGAFTSVSMSNASIWAAPVSGEEGRPVSGTVSKFDSKKNTGSNHRVCVLCPSIVVGGFQAGMPPKKGGGSTTTSTGTGTGAGTVIELPLELVGLVRAKDVAQGHDDDAAGVDMVASAATEEAEAGVDVSAMISRIEGRGVQELRCYVRACMMRTGFA
jgi:hypothetical protein